MPAVLARIETKARSMTDSTKPTPNTAEWAKWLEFQTFGDPKLVNAVNETARFIRAIKDGEEPRWISYVGTSGTGKTYLVKRIMRWLARSPHWQAQAFNSGSRIVYPGQFVHWPRMAAELQNREGYGWFGDIQSETFIALDEIGGERDSTGFVTEKLSTLLSARVGKWTMITSNKGLEQIARDLDTRIASRLIRDGNVVVEMSVADFALRKKQHHGAA